MRIDRLLIVLTTVCFIISGVFYLSATLVINLLVEHTEKTNLKAYSEVLTVEGNNYTTEPQTNVLGVSNEEYNGRLCGLETVTCKSEKVCNLDEISCLIKDKAEEYGIDWKIAIAISWHETGRYTSDNYLYKHNVGGTCYLGVVMTFESLEEGIEYFISNLKRNYFDKGLTTLELIQKDYAPIDAKNDPKGLNNYWLSGTTRIYESLEV